MSKPVILTGLRANSEFHIGNYLGAILPMLELQQKHAGKYQINMFIPDLHSFTTPIDHGKLFQNTLDNLKVFVAAGLDINDPDTFIYRQSYIPAHSELAWILDCFTYFGEASRMIEFKDKSQKLGNDTVSVGQFNYPILMAADILLYDAKYVPLGDDQQQHLELARDLAIRMNNKFGELFKVPESWQKQLEFTNRSSVRIRSLRNPEKKMSKSVDDPAGTIMLNDQPEEAAKKVMGATTDSIGKVNLDWEKQPGISNLLQIHALLSGETLDAVAKHHAQQTNYGELKQEVADQVKEFLHNLQAKLVKVDSNKLQAKLETDEKAMNKVANLALLKVQKAVGLRPA
ncbi:MAG TPA: tryptophan--tRNA ligase [Candidatus Saccharimonadales bacterium]|nr:tryptophan--tRNA ligase [Candidatus Saccharimonadales bacterium]